MTKRLTDKELAKIRERHAKTPGGKWEARGDGLGRWCVGSNDPPLGWGTFVDNKSREFCEFVANSKQDIPRLIDEVGRLREERDRYREAIRFAVEECDSPLEVMEPLEAALGGEE